MIKKLNLLILLVFGLFLFGCYGVLNEDHIYDSEFSFTCPKGWVFSNVAADKICSKPGLGEISLTAQLTSKLAFENMASSGVFRAGVADQISHDKIIHKKEIGGHNVEYLIGNVNDHEKLWYAELGVIDCPGEEDVTYILKYYVSYDESELESILGSFSCNKLT